MNMVSGDNDIKIYRLQWKQSGSICGLRGKSNIIKGSDQ